MSRKKILTGLLDLLDIKATEEAIKKAEKGKIDKVNAERLADAVESELDINPSFLDELEDEEYFTLMESLPNKQRSLFMGDDMGVQMADETSEMVMQLEPKEAAKSMELFSGGLEVAEYLSRLDAKGLKTFKENISPDDTALFNNALERLENIGPRKMKGHGGYSKDGYMGGGQVSMLVPPERMKKNRGGAIVRLIRDVLKRDVKEGKVPSRNDLDKAITKTKTTYPNLVNKYTKESKVEADDLRMLENYAAGGGGKTTMDSILASVMKPATESQEITTPLVRKQKTYRSDMAKNTGATAVGTALIMEASEAVKDIYNELNKTEREKFEAAFSKAHNAGKDTFKYKGEEYSTEVRKGKEHGGVMVMAMPSEFMDVPVDTYDNIPDDEKEAAKKSQLPDEEMETNYIEFVIDEALEEADQDYLMEILEQDDKLSNIFDQLMDVAAEFSGEGEVNGPGTGVSDSIPARLSDGEFVFTKKATDQIGADKLQIMMDNAERQFDENSRMKKAFGGITYDPTTGKRNDRMTEDELTEEAIKQQMINSNRMPSVMR